MVQLHQREALFSYLNTRIVVISFGMLFGASLWQTETGTDFTLLLDDERKAYHAYGLEHSYLRSWGIKTIWTYARYLASGRKWRGIQGDSGQLGGDFLVDAQGIVRLAHRSHDPTDRPSVDTLLSAVKKLSTTQPK